MIQAPLRADTLTYPGAPLIRVVATLYGTTGSGGAFNTGTVFSLTP